MDSVETVIRFRQSPSEGDVTIVLDVSTGYIVKNGSGWCTWGEDRFMEELPMF